MIPLGSPATNAKKTKGWMGVQLYGVSSFSSETYLGHANRKKQSQYFSLSKFVIASSGFTSRRAVSVVAPQVLRGHQPDHVLHGTVQLSGCNLDII